MECIIDIHQFPRLSISQYTPCFNTQKMKGSVFFMPIYKMDGKKDGLQKYRVRVNFVDNLGKSRQVERVVYGSKEAKEAENQLEREIKENSTKPKMTVNQLYEEYIQTKKHEVRESSLAKTKQILKVHILPHLGQAKLEKLTMPVLQKWKTEISEKETSKGLPLSIITKQKIFGELRALLNYAVRMEYIPKNPLLNLGNFKEIYFESQRDKIHYYTPAQFKQFITIGKDTANTLNDWGFYVFFNIAFYTGLRKGEINALKWTDIEDNYIHVSRSINQKLKGADRETPPKNKSSVRTIQLPAPLIEILKEHKKRQQKDAAFTDDYKICGGIQALRDTSISKKNIEFATKAELPIIRIHDFRHSHASLLANEGINIQEIARRLGHTKIEMTWNTYSHLYPREEERAIEILNKIV